MALTQPRLAPMLNGSWVPAEEAHDFARHGAGGLARLIRDFATNDRIVIAVDTLDEPPAVGRQIENHLGRMQAQIVEIDQVDVGLHASRQYSSIAQSIKLGG